VSAEASFISPDERAHSGAGKGSSPGCLGRTEVPQKPVVFCRLHCDNVLRKKGKQYFVNLALNMAVFTVMRGVRGLDHAPVNPLDTPL